MLNFIINLYFIELYKLLPLIYIIFFIIILTAALDGYGIKICSLFYYLTNFLVIIPICLRFRRIANCCEIKINERCKINENKKKHKNL